VVGSFEIAFYAKALNTSAGTPQVTTKLVRNNVGTLLNHTFTLTNDGAWHQYSFNFTGADTAASVQQNLVLTLTASNGSAETGATVYVDDAYLGKTTSSATGFRNEVVTTLQTMNPGSLRYMIPQTLGGSYPVYQGQSSCTWGGGSPDTPGGCDFEHGPIEGTAGSDTGGIFGGWYFSPTDLYPLANQYSAIPWFSIPDEFSDSDLKSFADDACTALSTYSNIPAIYIEGGNEEWNGGGDVKYQASNLGQLGYGGAIGRDFSIMATEASSKCAANASKIHYVWSNQLCNGGAGGIGWGVAAGASAAGYPIPNTSQYGDDDAPYYNYPPNLPAYSGSQANQALQYATTFFGYVPPYVGSSSSDCVVGDFTGIGSNNTISMYETGPNMYTGPGTTEQAYLSQAGYTSAAWMASAWLMGQQLLRVPVQNEFTLSQIEFGTSGVEAPIWGITHDFDSDFGPTFPHLRPIAMGMEVVNSAMGGAYYPVNAPSGTVINAFENKGAWSAALVNTTDAPITLTVEFPSSGTMPETAETVLTTNDLTDNSENSNDVFVGALPGGLSASGQNVTLTLPPYSVVAIH
jgi:hypothetical protein